MFMTNSSAYSENDRLYGRRLLREIRHLLQVRGEERGREERGERGEERRGERRAGRGIRGERSGEGRRIMN